MDTQFRGLAQRSVSALAPEVVVDVRALSKTYVQVQGGAFWRRQRKQVPALHEVSLQIPRGQMLAYLGRNGAGKSTTIKLLTGILRPTSGSVSVLGLEPYRQRLQLLQRVGVLFGQRSQLWWDLPLQDSFAAIRTIYGLSEARYRENLAEFTQILGLSNLLPVPVRQLSLGQRMRGELVAALLFEPEVVFLDEPTIGLDVGAKEQIREFLRRIRSERRLTVVLTTHDLGDIEALCDRVVVLDAGRIVYDASFDRMMTDHGYIRTMTVSYERAPTVSAAAVQEAGWDLVGSDANRLTVRYDGRRTTVPQVLAVVGEFGPVADLEVAVPRVEDVLRTLYLDGVNGDDQSGGGA